MCGAKLIFFRNVSMKSSTPCRVNFFLPLKRLKMAKKTIFHIKIFRFG